MSRRKKAAKTTVSFYLDDDVIAFIRKEAAKDDRSDSYIVNKTMKDKMNAPKQV